MSLYDLYETNTNLENEGVWVAITEELKVKVAFFGNKKNVQYLTKLKEPYKAQFRKGTIDPAIEEDLHVRAMAKYVLLDWEGVTDRNGKELPYSSEAAYKLLSDPSLRSFKNEIADLSTAMETFKREEIEESEKNSKKS